MLLTVDADPDKQICRRPSSWKASTFFVWTTHRRGNLGSDAVTNKLFTVLSKLMRLHVFLKLGGCDLDLSNFGMLVYGNLPSSSGKDAD